MKKTGCITANSLLTEDSFYCDGYSLFTGYKPDENIERMGEINGTEYFGILYGGVTGCEYIDRVGEIKDTTYFGILYCGTST